MGAFRYRAVTAAGALTKGTLESRSLAEAFEHLRRSGLTPIEAAPMHAAASARRHVISRKVLARAFGELAVMLDAGAALDRGLAVAAEDLQNPRDRDVFETLRKSVREGRPLSRAVGEAGPAFPSMAAAMIAAGESDGRPGAALAKLATALERAQALQSMLVSAMVYPAMLLVIAFGVIALMLFWVVPQFETLFSDAGANLPTMTRLVLGASHAARQYGLWALAAVVVGGFLAMRALKQPAARKRMDRVVLRLPKVGALVAMAESARFVRVLASLVEGGVALPDALALSRRSLVNTHMAQAVDGVARGLREGEGLTEPLAATGVFPKIALSYLRTGEQTAQLPLMLHRLADTLEREVRISLDRFLAILTPAITVAMGAIVATVIASIMSAILGFDNLALSK